VAVLGLMIGQIVADFQPRFGWVEKITSVEQ
jgi:hypothetical protein